MWRYRELMPLFDGEAPLTLGEGWTPLMHTRRLGETDRRASPLRQGRVTQPDQLVQGARPGGGGHTGGTSGRADVVGPVCRQCGNAMAAYAAAAGLDGESLHAKDVKVPFIRECEFYGADVTLVDGLITDAGRIATERGKPLGWYDVSTLKEPYRIEGKKTMATSWVNSSTGRSRTGSSIRPAAAPAWSVCGRPLRRLEAIGWKAGARARGWCRSGRTLRADRPRVRAGRGAVGAVSQRAHDRRWPARAEGDWRFSRPARRARERRDRARGLRSRYGRRDAGAGRDEGISAAPEGGAALHAVKMLVARGAITSADTVVVFNTGGALKYLDVLSA